MCNLLRACPTAYVMPVLFGVVDSWVFMFSLQHILAPNCCPCWQVCCTWWHLVTRLHAVGPVCDRRWCYFSWSSPIQVNPCLFLCLNVQGTSANVHYLCALWLGCKHSFRAVQHHASIALTHVRQAPVSETDTIQNVKSVSAGVSRSNTIWCCISAFM